MVKQIFVSLPVKNLTQSINFFKRLGFRFNPQFTDETTASMIVSKDVFVLLVTEDQFEPFTPGKICDAKQYTEVLIRLSMENREAVDEIVYKAVIAGGTTYRLPKNYGFMYAHSFQDLDGHIWEAVYVEPYAAPPMKNLTAQYTDSSIYYLGNSKENSN